MIVLDTHVWIWWIDNHPKLTGDYKQIIEQQKQSGELGVSIYSCWEIAKAVENNRLQFDMAVEDWLEYASSYSGVQMLPLTMRIIVESTQLPGDFHKDPADQIIVATSRVYDCPLVTYDDKILKYPHVKLLP
ncbi:MAG: type II toxin-antitoxin system VapC family toxin [Pyrinomonadaceae bacterium MAG19_C2-C3]|nr:type II toxin-antitoxin system VapC family toxin [Pyrinomonadaceae bacterium MAG19_C2-C3]